MLQLRCTKKVLEQFGIGVESLNEPASGNATLGNWYVNLVTIDRRKSLIFMSERSLLSFLLFGVRKDNAKNLAELFVNGYVQLLELEDFSETQIEHALHGCELITVAKTADRKAMGNMNDLMRIYDQKIYYDGGLKNCDMWSIISSTNRMPQRNIGWDFSIDKARELITELEGST